MDLLVAGEENLTEGLSINLLTSFVNISESSEFSPTESQKDSADQVGLHFPGGSTAVLLHLLGVWLSGKGVLDSLVTPKEPENN